MYKKRKAFTLIELLVVISIIALLIAILLPVLGNARDAARGAACMSNFRQVAIGEAVYQLDSDEYHVPVGIDSMHDDFYDEGSGVTSGRWTHLLEPYLNTYSIYNCPTLSGFRPDDRIANYDGEFGAPQRGRSKAAAGAPSAYSFFIGGRGGGTGVSTRPKRDTDLFGMLNIVRSNVPGFNVDVADLITFLDGTFYVKRSDPGVYSGGAQLFNVRSFIHGENINAAFLDGHVVNMAEEELRASSSGFDTFVIAKAK